MNEYRRFGGLSVVAVLAFGIMHVAVSGGAVGEQGASPTPNPPELAVLAEKKSEESVIVSSAAHDDIVLRALVDELLRGGSELRIEDAPTPYFIEYGLTDVVAEVVSASLGAVLHRDGVRSRSLRADVRVGDYELDNTNFQPSSGSGGDGGGAPMPVDDDYFAIRQAVWWTTDRRYKDAVETLAEKMAFMEGKMIENKPADFSHEAPTVSLEDRLDLSHPPESLQDLAQLLSAVFLEFPDVQDSTVTVRARKGNKYLVNTEGTRIRTGHQGFGVSITADAQADDGMMLTGGMQFESRSRNGLPPRDKMIADCRQLAQELLKAKNAPVLDAYTGPALFESEAAASLFHRAMSWRFVGGQRPVGSRTTPDDFANKLKKRILPRFVSVVDNPSLMKIGDAEVTGQYRFDDQGIPPKAVLLVENGRLQNLLMSRNPSREVSGSTGHGRGSGVPRSAIGVMVVSANPSSDAATLREELIEACQDEGLEFGIRVAALGTVGSGDGGGGITPLLMYKVFSDGHEEMVRGAELARVDLKVFKRLLAVGDTPHVQNFSGFATQTLAVPALLFEELDLAKIDRDYNKQPILPSPLARANPRSGLPNTETKESPPGKSP